MRATGAAAREAAESAEASRTASARRGAASALETFLAELIVDGTLVAIAQNLKGFGDL